MVLQRTVLIVDIENDKKASELTLASIIPITIVFLLTYMLTTDTSEAKHQFKCYNWSAELR
jgi:hypothetical protein